MEDYAQIYWLDERNAGPRDHRTQGGTSSSGWRPGAVVRSPSGPIPLHPRAEAVLTQPTGWQPMTVAQPITVMPQPQTYFGGLSLGEIISMAAQALAALQPLPAAPVATKEVETDVGNLVLYQTAIAQHAKRDEQLRTLGSLISKFIK